MAARRPEGESSREGRGNFVSEWFGHRVYPQVATSRHSLEDQRASRCPFLSSATLEERTCIKPSTSSGICTISSCSNGPRQDWLVCPYRALDTALFGDVARRLFGIPAKGPLVVMPAPALSKQDSRKALKSGVAACGAGIIYFQDKLGGEISLAATERSPELAFDTTMVEILQGKEILTVGRYGILEAQTMDFHGSYRHVVNNLKDGLRLHAWNFHRVLQDNHGWLSEKIEGPNIANVFKRTFYQIMLKFQIGAHASCAGCVLAIPLSVWDSWQKHLGKPDLHSRGDGTFELKAFSRKGSRKRVPAWIYVFDIAVSRTQSPNPLRICKVIATDADSISHYALKVAPEVAIAAGGSADRIRATILRRLGTWWPELANEQERTP